MLITKTSPLTGLTHTRDITAKPEDLNRWKTQGGLVQNVMPYLSADDREFLMTGITPEEWEDAFGGERMA